MILSASIILLIAVLLSLHVTYIEKKYKINAFELWVLIIVIGASATIVLNLSNKIVSPETEVTE